MKTFINSLYVEGFKNLHKKTILFRPLTVLAGGNSVGKSSVIQCLLIVQQTITWENSLKGILHNSFKNDTSEKNNLVVQIPLNNSLLALGNVNDIRSRKSNKDYILFRFDLNTDNDEPFPLALYYQALIGSYHLNFDFEIGSYHLNFDFENDVKVPGNEKDFLGLNSLSQISIRYLNAERIGPRQHYDINSNSLQVGYQGEYAISILSSEIAKTHLVPPHCALVADEADLRLINVVEQWMQYIVPGININAQRLEEVNRSFVKYNGVDKPHNVGFGISYVLPIIVAGLIASENDILIIENPEAHLHPLGQTRIGYFLAKIAANNIQVVVETHSELLIDGMQLAVLDDVLPHKDLVINFFKQDKVADDLYVQPIYLNEMAELSAFPRDFFDQTRQNIAQMIRLRRQKSKA